MKNKKQDGFTLIELLVVMVVLLSTGMVIGTILFSSLRGATKASIINTARQNGDFVISQMVKTIRNAKAFGGVSNDNVQWITDCSQNAIMQYKYVNITGPDDNKIVYSCAHSVISSNSVSLIDDTSVHIDDTSCYFTCLQSSPSDNPTIGINFSIVQSKQGALSESSVSLPFSTTVRMRNSLR